MYKGLLFSDSVYCKASGFGPRMSALMFLPTNEHIRPKTKFNKKYYY